MLRSRNIQTAVKEMKEYASLYWTVAWYFVLSTICVTANKLYAKPSDAEADMDADRSPMHRFAPGPLAADSEEQIPQLNPMADDSLITTEPPQTSTTSTAIFNPPTKPPTSPSGLPIDPILAQGNKIGTVARTTGNYILSFEVVPIGINANWGSILHFTNGDDCCNFGNRSPGIWFWPGSTQLHCRIGDSTNGNWGIDTLAIPLNVRTKVTIECNGVDVKVTVGANVYTDKQPTSRFAGDLTVYAGDPWYPAANAQVYNLDYKILPAGTNAGNGFDTEIISYMHTMNG